MQELIVSVLKPKFDGLPFLGRVAGLAQTLRTVDTESNQKRWPIDDKGNDLVPDSGAGGLLYFEHQRLNVVGTAGQALSLESILRVIFWGAVTDAMSAAYMQVALIKCVPLVMYNPAPLSKLIHSVERILLPQDGLFDKYTYSEQTNQYLLAPFTAFGFDVKTKFNASLDCLQNAV